MTLLCIIHLSLGEIAGQKTVMVEQHLSISMLKRCRLTAGSCNHRQDPLQVATVIEAIGIRCYELS